MNINEAVRGWKHLGVRTLSPPYGSLSGLGKWRELGVRGPHGLEASFVARVPGKLAFSMASKEQDPLGPRELHREGGKKRMRG